LYVIATVANALATGWLCVLALAVAFVVPAAYAQRQQDVDRVLARAHAHWNDASGKYVMALSACMRVCLTHPVAYMSLYLRMCMCV
jgi:hypothetical protein